MLRLGFYFFGGKMKRANKNDTRKKNAHQNSSIHDGIKVAVLVDGGFYRKRANYTHGAKTPKERADELDSYCRRHLTETINGIQHEHDLYRIFYYDCMPSKKAVFNPLTKKNDELSKSATYSWTTDFLEELKAKRKFAVRLGEISDSTMGYTIPANVTKELLLGKRDLSSLKPSDLELTINQKGVDMRIGVDIASMAFKHQVSQIVLIAGDSDFVPAAKLARREGIDFVLDPLGAKIKDSLYEHIDGLRSCDFKYTPTKKDK